MRALAPCAIADTRAEPPGSPLPLIGGGARDALRFEPPHAGRRIEQRAAHEPAESTTTRTPSIVRLVSAMFVASTTLRAPALAGSERGILIRADRSPNSGSTRTPLPSCADSSSDCTRRISPAPGRKTSMSPLSSLRARCTICARRIGAFRIAAAGSRQRRALAHESRLDGKHPALRRHHRRIAQQPRDRRAVQRRGHHQQLQIRRQVVARIQRERQARGRPAGCARGTHRRSRPQRLRAPGRSAASG